MTIQSFVQSFRYFTSLRSRSFSFSSNLLLPFIRSLIRILPSPLLHRAHSRNRRIELTNQSSTVPAPVLGGVTTFLFSSVSVSGLRVLSYIPYTRRDRFILSAALSFGFGNLLVPGVFTHLFDSVLSGNGGVSAGLRGLLDSITIVISTPCEFKFFGFWVDGLWI